MGTEIQIFRYCDLCQEADGSKVEADGPNEWTLGVAKSKDKGMRWIIDLCESCLEGMTVVELLAIALSQQAPTVEPEPARKILEPVKPEDRKHIHKTPNLLYPCIECHEVFSGTKAYHRLIGHLRNVHQLDAHALLKLPQCPLDGEYIKETSHGLRLHSVKEHKGLSVFSVLRQARDSGDTYGVIEKALKRAIEVPDDVLV